jgi:hypothetical protein
MSLIHRAEERDADKQLTAHSLLSLTQQLEDTYHQSQLHAQQQQMHTQQRVQELTQLLERHQSLVPTLDQQHATIEQLKTQNRKSAESLKRAKLETRTVAEELLESRDKNGM